MALAPVVEPWVVIEVPSSFARVVVDVAVLSAVAPVTFAVAPEAKDVPEVIAVRVISPFAAPAAAVTRALAPRFALMAAKRPSRIPANPTSVPVAV